eukprot:365080-Chlamydomonas_euryale.AAC.2
MYVVQRLRQALQGSYVSKVDRHEGCPLRLPSNGFLEEALKSCEHEPYKGADPSRSAPEARLVHKGASCTHLLPHSPMHLLPHSLMHAHPKLGLFPATPTPTLSLTQTGHGWNLHGLPHSLMHAHPKLGLFPATPTLSTQGRSMHVAGAWAEHACSRCLGRACMQQVPGRSMHPAGA